MSLSSKRQAYAISPQGREMVSHGTPLFPVAFYSDDLNLDIVPWHWHDEMEAIVVNSGEMALLVGSERYIVRAGEGFFINANALHAARSASDRHCAYHSVVFHPRLIDGGMDSVFWQNYLRLLVGNAGLKGLALDHSAPWHADTIQNIEGAWQAGVSEEYGHEFVVRALLSQFALTLTRFMPSQHVATTDKTRRDNARMRDMLRFIQSHYSEALTIADIAASAAISTSECLRCFQSTIGRPPMQYVRQYRVQRASELLTSTQMKIADIGTEVGFQDNSYFTRAFREIRGMTPAEYRKSKTDRSLR